MLHSHNPTTLYLPTLLQLLPSLFPSLLQLLLDRCLLIGLGIPIRLSAKDECLLIPQGLEPR